MSDFTSEREEEREGFSLLLPSRDMIMAASFPGVLSSSSSLGAKR